MKEINLRTFQSLCQPDLPGYPRMADGDPQMFGFTRETRFIQGGNIIAYQVFSSRTWRTVHDLWNKCNWLAENYRGPNMNALLRNTYDRKVRWKPGEGHGRRFYKDTTHSCNDEWVLYFLVMKSSTFEHSQLAELQWKQKFENCRIWSSNRYHYILGKISIFLSQYSYPSS